jgi:hypothetical protein
MATAAALPLSVALWGQSAQGTVGSTRGLVLNCSQSKGAIVLTPGLSDAPTNQTVSAHGRVYGCNKVGGEGKYTARLTMTRATCAARRFEGQAQFAWANGRESTAFLKLVSTPVAPRKAEVNGVITSGMFNGSTVRSWVRMTDTFRGSGPECGPTNLLERINLTSNRCLMLYTPKTTTTTVPQHSSTSAPPTTEPPTHNTVGPQGTTPATTVAQLVRQLSSDDGGGAQGPFGGTGSLALTGSNSGGALLGLGSLLAGAVVLAIGGNDRRHDPARSTRRRRDRRHGARPWLYVTLPGD